MALSTTKCVRCHSGLTLSALPIGFDPPSSVFEYSLNFAVSDNGGVVIDMGPIAGALIPLGYVTITPAALEILLKRGEHFWQYINRHALGDWGIAGTFEGTKLTLEEIASGILDREDEDEDDNDNSKSNKLATLRNFGLIHSIYVVSGSPNEHYDNEEFIWVMTDMLRGGECKTIMMLASHDRISILFTHS